jgi:glycosyltransferase involved in cell wall biosynthesis
MRDRLRIAFVTEVWRPSINGVVTRLEATLRELRRRGHDLLVIAPDAGAPDPEVQVVGAPTVRIWFIYGGQPWGLPVPGLARALDAFAPDVVHAVNPVLLGWAGVRYARRRGVPLVCSYHTRVADYSRYYRLGALERWTEATIRSAHRMADLNLVTSRVSSGDLGAWGLDSRLWRGGLDRAAFRRAPARPDVRARLTGGHPERDLVLNVGRLAREKDLARLGALAEGRRHLALVGDGPARAELEAALAGRQVTFAGWMTGDDLTAAYGSADVFVTTSTTETLGLALLEARGCGLPVVAARTPVTLEILGEAYGARLVAPGEQRLLVAAVDELLAERPDRDVIAAEARAATATWSEATDDLLACYREVLPETTG